MALTLTLEEKIKKLDGNFLEMLSKLLWHRGRKTAIKIIESSLMYDHF